MPNTGFDRVMRGVRRGVVSHVDDQRTRAADGLTGIADMMEQTRRRVPRPALEPVEDGELAAAGDCGTRARTRRR